MINLPVSEAYAFDYLSILMVKAMNGIKGAAEEYASCRDALIEQLGMDAVFVILESEEAYILHHANAHVWLMVGKAANDECRASDVDKANQLRYNAKKALQARFWPDKPIAEVKAPRPYER